MNSLTKLNYEPNENNYRVELEQHFSRIFELLYLKSRYEQDRKRNIFKGISIIEVIMSNHHKICSSRGDIKLEFEIQINEQNDEILNFKVNKFLIFIFFPFKHIKDLPYKKNEKKRSEGYWAKSEIRHDISDIIGKRIA